MELSEGYAVGPYRLVERAGTGGMAEVRAEIQAFVSGRIGEHELEGWLDSVSAEVHAQGAPDLRALTDRAYSLLAEVGYVDRTIDDARGELAKLGPRGTTTGLESTHRLGRSAWNDRGVCYPEATRTVDDAVLIQGGASPEPGHARCTLGEMRDVLRETRGVYTGLLAV